MRDEEHPLEPRTIRIESGEPGLPEAGGQHHQACAKAFVSRALQRIEGLCLDRIRQWGWCGRFECSVGLRQRPGCGDAAAPVVREPIPVDVARFWMPEQRLESALDNLESAPIPGCDDA